MPEPWITPQTDAELTVTVTQGGALRDDAVLTADVYSPTGVHVATAEPLTARGGGTGEYILAVQAEWSDSTGKPVEGEFVAQVKATRAGAQTVTRFRYTVRFNDDD